MSQFKSFWVKNPPIIEKCEGETHFFYVCRFQKKTVKKKNQALVLYCGTLFFCAPQFLFLFKGNDGKKLIFPQIYKKCLNLNVLGKKKTLTIVKGKLIFFMHVNFKKKLLKKKNQALVLYCGTLFFCAPQFLFLFKENQWKTLIFFSNLQKNVPI